jgi:hypothetical protein
LEASRSCASVTEYYRSSSGSGRSDPYADYNYIVANRNTFEFNISSPTDAFLKDHSYAHEWFTWNIKYGKGSDIGFWRENTVLGGSCLGKEGYIGVIYGPENKLECNYPYVKGYEQSQIHYPGNKRDWDGMEFAWWSTYDLKLVGAKSVENAQFKTGIPRRLNVDVEDACDIQTLDRSFPWYRLVVSVSDLDGSNVREIETLPIQQGTHFDF